MNIVRNLSWNWLGIAVDAIVAFLLCPYLISQLGMSEYGAWVMIGSLTGYFGLLDLGIRGSVGRFVAYYLAKDQQKSASEIVSTAILMLVATGVVGMLGTWVVARYTDVLVGQEFTAASLQSIQWAIIIAGINLAVQLPSNGLEGVLWGCQRFDQLNKLRIPAITVRGLLSAGVVFLDGGLLALSIVTLMVTTLTGFAKIRLAYAAFEGFQIQVRLCSLQRARELSGFGLWSTIRAVASMIPARFVPLLVGVFSGASVVVPLSVAARLVATASALLVASSGVITPHATSLHASKSKAEQNRLLLLGGYYATAGAGMIFALFYLLGEPLLRLWVGAELATAYPLLVTLGAGRCASMTQVVTRSIITAQARHRSLAFASVTQGVMTLLISLALIEPYGVLGVAIAVAVADACCEGGFALIFGCQLLKQPMSTYLLRTVGTAALALTPPSACLAVALQGYPVAGWTGLALHGIGFCVGSALWMALIHKCTRGIFSGANEGLVVEPKAHPAICHQLKVWKHALLN